MISFNISPFDTFNYPFFKVTKKSAIYGINHDSHAFTKILWASTLQNSIMIPSKYKTIGSGYRYVTSDVIVLKLTDYGFQYFTNIIKEYLNAESMPSVVFEQSRIAGAKSPRLVN